MSISAVRIDATGLPRGDALWAAAARGKLGPILHAGRLAFAAPPPSPAWKARFRREYFASVVSHHLYRGAAVEILGEARQRGIPAILLRGTAVAERYYAEDPALRPYTDIDLLVPRESLDETKRLARQLGYRPGAGAFPDAFYERHHLHLRYLGKRTGMPLEIHWAVDHPLSTHRIDYAALFRAAASDRLAGHPVLRLSATDEFLLLALHLAKHASAVHALPPALLPGRALERGLVLWMLDLDRIVRLRGAAFDWDALLARAEEWEVTAHLGAAVSATATVLGTQVPGVVRRRLLAADPVSAIERGCARLANGRGPLGRRLRAWSGRLSSSPAFFSLERGIEIGRILLPSARWVQRHGPAPGLPLLLRRGLYAAFTAGRGLGMIAEIAALLTARAPRRLTRRDSLPEAREHTA